MTDRFDKASYDANYERDNIKRIVVKVNRKTEPQITEHLAKIPNVQRYILNLIAEDIEKKSSK